MMVEDMGGSVRRSSEVSTEGQSSPTFHLPGHPDPLGGDGSPPWADALLYLYLPFSLVSALTFATNADDPFITLRYAANLVHGYGLAFNEGQHVQSFTSPLHLAIAVVAYATPGSHALFKLKLASLAFGILALRESGQLIYGIPIPRWAKRLGCVAVGSCWIVGFASGNALETSLVVWLLIALPRRLIIQGPGRSVFVTSVFAFAAVLARLDTLAPLVCMAVVGLLIEHGASGLSRVRWFWGAIVGSVVTAACELEFFGNLLPNTYYAKHETMSHAWSWGVQYLLNPVHTLVSGVVIPGQLAAAIVIVQIVLVIPGIYVIVRSVHRCSYLFAIVVGQCAFILVSGGDWMNGGRFLAPAVIPLIVIELFGITWWIPNLQAIVRWRTLRDLVALMALVIIVPSIVPLWYANAPVWSFRGIDDRSLLLTGHYASYSKLWTEIPNVFRCIKDGQLGATTEAGYLGFSRLGLKILDLRGLASRHDRANSPDYWKSSVGSYTPDWYLTSSPVGRIILARGSGSHRHD